jgi:Carboxypeptidase regulatory-like domain
MFLTIIKAKSRLYGPRGAQEEWDFTYESYSNAKQVNLEALSLSGIELRSNQKQIRQFGNEAAASRGIARSGKYRRWAVLAQWLLLLPLITPNLVAQDSSAGTFSGTVTDPDGHFVRVPLEVVNVATKVTFRTMASAEGEYSFSQLPAGMYQLTVQVLATSYRNFSRDNIKVASGQNIKLDIHLQEGIGLNTLGDGREFSRDVTHANLVKLVVPAGPTPRMPDGKPDLSGYWSASGGSFDAGIPEFQNWASELARKRQADDLRDLPSARCQPNGIVLAVNTGAAQRIAQIAGLLVMYSEGQLPRQIFLDGRTHPDDPNPTWRGHSIGRWEGETLVTDTIGFNDKPWLDWNGHPHTGMLHVVERYRRPDLGHLELEMTVEDRGALKTSWLLKRTYILDPREDILESVCTENERDLPHLFVK